MPKETEEQREERWRERLRRCGPGPRRSRKRPPPVPPPPRNEELREFVDRHGGDEVFDAESDFHVLPDGATFEAGAWGRRIEPPTDAYEKAKLVLRYWTLRYEAAVNDFEAERAQLRQVERANVRRGLPPPGARELAQLRRLCDDARSIRGRVQAAEAKVERTEPAEVKRKRRLRDMEDDRRTEYVEWKREFDRINL